MQKQQNKAKKQKSESPPLLGLSVAVLFLIWGGLVFYIPTYLEIKNSIVFDVIGFIFLIISFVGTLIEISYLWKTEAFSYWSVSLFFIAPAILLHLSLNYYGVVGYWATIIKSIVIGLMMIGTAFIPIGFAYLPWKTDNKEDEEKTSLNKEERGKANTERLQLFISLVVTIITLATAIVQLISQLAN